MIITLMLLSGLGKMPVAKADVSDAECAGVYQLGRLSRLNLPRDTYWMANDRLQVEFRELYRRSVAVAQALGSHTSASHAGFLEFVSRQRSAAAGVVAEDLAQVSRYGDPVMLRQAIAALPRASQHASLSSLLARLCSSTIADRIRFARCFTQGAQLSFRLNSFPADFLAASQAARAQNLDPTSPFAAMQSWISQTVENGVSRDPHSCVSGGGGPGSGSRASVALSNLGVGVPTRAQVEAVPVTQASAGDAAASAGVAAFAGQAVRIVLPAAAPFLVPALR